MTWFASESREANNALDVFLGQCLHGGGVWPSPREGDGIARLRVIERTRSRVRLIGRVWMIAGQVDGTGQQESFWLDLSQDSAGLERVSFSLHFGLSSFGRGRPRDLKDAVELMDTPEQGTWRAFLTGTAVLDGDQLRELEIDRAVR